MNQPTPSSRDRLAKTKDAADILLNLPTLVGLWTTGLASTNSTINGWLLTLIPYFDRVPVALKVAAGVLGILLTIVYARKRIVKSTLVAGAELRLDPAQPRHLVGRELDVEQVTTLCKSCPLTFLVGEAGAGKTSLLRAGVSDRLLSDRSVIPVYVDISARDWTDGAAASVLDSLKNSLSSSDYSRVVGHVPERDHRDVLSAMNGSQLVATLERALRRLQSVDGRRPVLLFDQFDDYQTRHRDKFFPNGARKLLLAPDLIQQNHFWKLMHQLLAANIIHCLIVTREDMALALASVRLIEEPLPETYALERLPQSAVRTVLDRLTIASELSPPLISNLSAGWEQLRAQIEADVENGTGVLPARLSLALQGLSTLPHLTVAEYKRHGGLLGLERRYIEFYTRAAARQSACDEALVRKLLLSMVAISEVAVGGRSERKTQPQSEEDLQRTWETYGGKAEGWRAVVDYLRRPRIVRKRLDALSGIAVYSLAHDTLCNAVSDLEDYANRYRREIADAHAQHERGSQSTLQWWDTLLPPRRQFALFTARIKGRFSYAGYRRFAAVSLVRFAPMILLLCTIGVSAFGYFQERAVAVKRATAHSLLASIGNVEEYPLSELEVTAFQSIAAQPLQTRLMFLQHALEPGNATRTRRRLPLCVRAAVGLDLRSRERAITEVLRPALLAKHDDFAATATAVECAGELGYRDEAVAIAVKHFWTEQFAKIPETASDDHWKLMVHVLKEQTVFYRESDFRQIFTSVAQNATNRELSDQGIQALQIVIPSLDDRDLPSAFRLGLSLVFEWQDNSSRNDFARAIAAIATRLSATDPELVRTEFAAALRRPKAPYVATAIGEMLLHLPPKVSESLTRTATEQIAPLLARSTDMPYGLPQVFENSSVVERLVRSLKTDDQRAVYAPIRDSLLKATHDVAVRELIGGTLACLSVLSTDEVADLKAQLVLKLEEATSDHDKVRLLPLLFEIERSVVPADRASIREVVLRFGQQSSGSYARMQVVAHLASIDMRLSSEEFVACVDMVLKDFDAETDSFNDYRKLEHVEESLERLFAMATPVAADYILRQLDDRCTESSKLGGLLLAANFAALRLPEEHVTRKKIGELLCLQLKKDPGLDNTAAISSSLIAISESIWDRERSTAYFALVRAAAKVSDYEHTRLYSPSGKAASLRMVDSARAELVGRERLEMCGRIAALFAKADSSVGQGLLAGELCELSVGFAEDDADAFCHRLFEMGKEKSFRLARERIACVIWKSVRHMSRNARQNLIRKLTTDDGYREELGEFASSIDEGAEFLSGEEREHLVDNFEVLILQAENPYLISKLVRGLCVVQGPMNRSLPKAIWTKLLLIMEQSVSASDLSEMIDSVSPVLEVDMEWRPRVFSEVFRVLRLTKDVGEMESLSYRVESLPGGPLPGELDAIVEDPIVGGMLRVSGNAASNLGSERSLLEAIEQNGGLRSGGDIWEYVKARR